MNTELVCCSAWRPWVARALIGSPFAFQLVQEFYSSDAPDEIRAEFGIIAEHVGHLAAAHIDQVHDSTGVKTLASALMTLNSKESSSVGR